MKKNCFKLLCWIMVLIPTVFISCNKEDEEEETMVTITFENLNLSSQGYWNGSDLKGKMVKEYYYGSLVTNYYNEVNFGEIILHNLYTQTWQSWNGFAVSSLTNKIAPGSNNVYSVYDDCGASLSNQFLVASNDATMNFNEGKEKKVNSVRVNNCTYTYLAIAEGNDGEFMGCTKFSDGDYFSVTFTGYDINGNITNDCTYYLADFRDGKSYICEDWTTVNISSLGKVNKIVVTFDSSDKNEYGILTPTYVCLDDFVYTY